MNDANNQPTYRMTVDLNVLDHLADGLYSSVAAVLTEAVANAWDADAHEVRIRVNLQGDEIVISDDGIGMDNEAINEHYLRVGYRRRDDSGDTSPGGRDVMGRKGIGKLSLMSIADTIEVRSKMEEKSPIGLRIWVPDLREAMKENRPEYSPQPLDGTGMDFDVEQGTHITIAGLKRARLRDVSADSLRRRLARRFSVVGGSDFRVFVDDTEVTSEDRDDLKFVEYLWVFGDSEVVTASCQHLKVDQPFRVEARLEGWPENWRVRGWIGTVDRPRSLTTPEGNLNSVVVLARGRLVQEDVLPRIAGAEVYTKYITGQVQADFLDDSNQDDIVTSNRQSLVEDDERVTRLVELLKKTMRDIANEWSKHRARDKTSELRGKYPGVGTWLDDLETGWKTKAEKLLERIATMELVRDESNSEDGRRTLLRHAILGFERLRLRGDSEELERALGKGVDALLRLLSDRDTLEASLYQDIVRNRLDVIRELDKLREDNEKERVLQEYLFEHLWLLDPAWERTQGTEAMEERFRLKKPFGDDEDTKEKYGRVDIQYRTIVGKHVIIELKRASVRTDIYELAQQGAKYVDALKELLPPEEMDRAAIEVIFVVGRSPSQPSERIENAMNSVAPGSRIDTYDLLIARAQQAYAGYLRGADKADRIENMLRELGDVDTAGEHPDEAGGAS